MTPPSNLKGKLMTENTVIAKLTANKQVIIKRSLIIVGAVVGIALTAGLIVKNKSALETAAETAVDAINDLKK